MKTDLEVNEDNYPTLWKQHIIYILWFFSLTHVYAFYDSYFETSPLYRKLISSFIRQDSVVKMFYFEIRHLVFRLEKIGCRAGMLSLLKSSKNTYASY
jgi:hypothetical protein